MAGFFSFFRASILLLVASVVDKLLFACRCRVCLFSSRSGASVAVCDFCGILAIFVRGFSVSSLLAFSPIVCSEPDQCFARVSVCRLQHGRPTTVCPRDYLLKTCRRRRPLQMRLLLLCPALARRYQRIRLLTLWFALSEALCLPSWRQFKGTPLRQPQATSRQAPPRLLVERVLLA